jgi:hypothetical protein
LRCRRPGVLGNALSPAFFFDLRDLVCLRPLT